MKKLKIFNSLFKLYNFYYILFDNETMKKWFNHYNRVKYEEILFFKIFNKCISVTVSIYKKKIFHFNCIPKFHFYSNLK